MKLTLKTFDDAVGNKRRVYVYVDGHYCGSLIAANEDEENFLVGLMIEGAAEYELIEA